MILFVTIVVTFFATICQCQCQSTDFQDMTSSHHRINQPQYMDPNHRKSVQDQLRWHQYQPGVLSIGGNSENNKSYDFDFKEKDNGDDHDDRFRNAARLTLDGASCVRLFLLSFYAFSEVTVAFVGTLRLLAPLIVARRVLISIGHFFTDYATGRYFRKTYTRLERAYMNYYELPAAMRSLSRSLSLVSIYIVLSRVMAKFSGCVPTLNAILPHNYDELQPQDVTYLCSTLWVGTVVWLGHTISSAIAIWGGPLRTQVSQHHQTRTRPSAAEVFTRPRHILQLMSKPDEWLSTLSMWTVPGGNSQFNKREQFAPNRILFPTTWRPLKVLQICVIAKLVVIPFDLKQQSNVRFANRAPEDISQMLLNEFLLQLALGDEWMRVFLEEKRVGLGVVIMIFYCIALVSTIITASIIDVGTTLFFLPSLLGALVSAWLNIVIFWSRLEFERKRAAIAAMNTAKSRIVASSK